MSIAQCKIQYLVTDAIRRLIPTLPRLDNGQVNFQAIGSQIVTINLSDILEIDSDKYENIRRQADDLAAYIFSCEIPEYGSYDMTMISSVGIKSDKSTGQNYKKRVNNTSKLVFYKITSTTPGLAVAEFATPDNTQNALEK